MDKRYQLKIGKSLIWIGIGLGGIFWVFEAIVHAVVFKKGDFIDELFTDDPEEIWMRLAVIALFIGFGVFAQFTFNKLQQASKQIKILTGLLPICAKCKKIRDDNGYWNQIEVYIRDHSEAEFSHGFCQVCAEQYYPGLDIYDD